MRHYIQTEDFTADEYRMLMDRAAQYEAEPESSRHLCEGKIIATMFFKESTRTSAIFQAAMQKMGGGNIGIQGIAGTYIASGEEDEEDTMRTLAPFCDIMAVRHNYLDLNQFRDNFPIPLINGMVGSDEHTLCGIFYLYTFRKVLGRVDNLKIGIYGQNKNCRPYKTLMKAVSLFGGTIYEDPVVDGLATPSHIIDFVREHGGTYERRPLNEFIGEVDVLCITDGMPSSKEDPALMEEYNRKWHTLEPEDLKDLKGHFEVMMPRAMTDGRITTSKKLDTDPRNLGDESMRNSTLGTMAVITYLLEQAGKL